MSRPSQRIKGSENNMAVESVSMPVSLLEKMVEAARALEAFEDELEDHLLSGRGLCSSHAPSSGAPR